jgi:hypothetical protein
VFIDDGWTNGMGGDMKTNKMTEKFAWRVVAAFAIVSGTGTSAGAQTVVVGTGDPNIDVPAVQAAVDQGGNVILKGHFSFDTLPPIPPRPPPLDGYGPAMVLVSKAVSISGVQDEHGETTSIEGGQVPFEVEALGSSVRIQNLHFVHSKARAITVFAVSGLVIASCKIEGVEPANTRGGINISTSFNPPTPDQPGQPGNVSGTLLIVNNDIDIGGTVVDNSLGVVIFSVGTPGAGVDIYVSGNNIRNTTEPAINIRYIAGRAQVVGNVITTGSVAGPAARPQAIRVVNTGSYLIAHNSIDCGWAVPDAQGIGVFSQFVEWPLERSIVVDNDVTMSPPEDTVFTDQSAGISISGFAQGNVVLNNRIRGRAQAALSAVRWMGGIPADNAFVLNRFDKFEPALADVFVDEGVIRTLIVGPGTVEDRGVDTIIERLP